MENIDRRIKNLIAENAELSLPIEQVDMERNLVELGLNSISYIKLVIAMENEFEIQFGDDDLDYKKFETINSIVNYISKNFSY